MLIILAGRPQVLVEETANSLPVLSVPLESVVITHSLIPDILLEAQEIQFAKCDGAEDIKTQQFISVFKGTANLLGNCSFAYRDC